MPRPWLEKIFSPTQGSGILLASNPGPGSRTTINMPCDSSQATSHSIILVGSELAPCTTAFDSASVKASSILSSLPSAHFISRTTFITLCTTGSTALRSAQRVTLSFKINSFEPGLHAECCESEGEEESDIGGLLVFAEPSVKRCSSLNL